MITAPAPFANPKPPRAGSADASCWYRFYAMFSERFADEVLTEARLPPKSVVLDPWLGVGTTTAIAARKDYRPVGIDISPVMATIAKGRSLDQASAAVALASAVKASQRPKRTAPGDDDPIREWFGPTAAAELRWLERTIRGHFPGDQSSGEFGFLMTSLFEAARVLAGRYRSKNPTWIKKPTTDELVDCRAGDVTQSFLGLARGRVSACQPETALPADIRIGTSIRLPLPDRHADFVLTSPPYCTRIDYAVSTRIEMAVLGGEPSAVDDLRDRMMGTSTIRRTPAAASDAWGPTCTSFLTHVREHPSKASKNYYYKTFVQYFGDLSASLSEIDRCTKPGAGVVIVVQDSHYKGTRADLALIVSEMAARMRWRMSRREDYRVAQTMRRVNTRSREYRQDATSQETVLWFCTPV